MDEDQILSVCSGIGGLDLGLSAGLRAVGRSPRVVCLVEREAFAVSVMAHQMQEGRVDECPIWLGDLRDLPLDELPEIDWITSGYPCQPFAYCGKRLGGEDPRHLWPTILGHVRTLRPRGVFFENVAGHLTLGLDQVLRDLDGSGYRCAFGLFSAEEVGAPHRRERVFILGLADGDRHPCRSRESRRAAGGIREAGEGLRRGEGEGEAGEESRRRRSHVADAWSERGRLRDASGQNAEDARQPSRHPWPARPDQQPHAMEPARTIPSIRRGSHGLPDRVDRLRALGNSVVPQQAERAFIQLWEEVARC